MRIGAIGIDSSHLPEFTRRIAKLNEAGKTSCRVTRFWTDGEHDWPNQDDLEKWRADTMAMGVEPAEALEELLDNVDGVMVLAVNGNRHRELAMPALERGMPTYIDKPLACDLEDAKAILQASRDTNAPCYSASSLRFITEIPALDRALLGELKAIDAYGPGELHDMMPGVLHYGVHTVELVDAVWGPGVKRVSAIETPDRHLVDLDYHDGRYARLRLERAGAYDFGATIHGTEGVTQFRVNFEPVYTRLVEGMVRFFEHREPPVGLRDIVENVAVMLAANRSIASDGAWTKVERVE